MYQWLATSLHSSSLSDQACDQFASDNKSVFMRAKKEIFHVADFCCSTQTLQVYDDYLFGRKKRGEKWNINSTLRASFQRCFMMMDFFSSFRCRDMWQINKWKVIRVGLVFLLMSRRHGHAATGAGSWISFFFESVTMSIEVVFTLSADVLISCRFELPTLVYLFRRWGFR